MISMQRRSLLIVSAAVAVSLAGCAGGLQQRDLYADVEIGLKAGFELVTDISNKELESRAACDALKKIDKLDPTRAEETAAATKTCKPEGTYVTRAQAQKALQTLSAAKTAARLAADTTSGCVQPMDSEAATALERLGLAGCVTSDQVLIAALAATRLLRENLEE